ncbi:MAG: LCP family protein [Brotaphodocola sp.]
MGKNKIMYVAMGIAMVFLTVFGWYTFRMYENRKMTEAILAERYAEMDMQDGKGTEAQNSTSTDMSSLSEGHPRDPVFQKTEVTWNGRNYRRNSYVKAILCMGVDRSDSMQEYRGFNEAGQADGIFLIAQDTAHNHLKILMIPRDTMTEIGIIDEDMNYVGTMVKQLTLAYANGDGREGSCENMVEAVEKLLQGLQIDHYLAADTKIIASLNDAVGGVTVTVPTPGMEKKDPAFVMGETITLHGDQAESFVRYRDIEKDYSALYRMNQQKAYITGFFQALKETSKTNSQIVTQLFDRIQEYMVTDMGKEIYLKIAADALQGDSLQNGDFYTVPGSGVTTEVYDEFYADEDGIVQIILELFYRETE